MVDSEQMEQIRMLYASASYVHPDALDVILHEGNLLCFDMISNDPSFNSKFECYDGDLEQLVTHMRSALVACEEQRGLIIDLYLFDMMIFRFQSYT
jgi:hypothetical protein